MKSASQLKQDVALHLLPEIQEKPVLLLGSGTTVTTIIQHLTDFDIRCVSSSTATSLVLQQNNLLEVKLDQVRDQDRTCIDGADLVLREEGILIKGHGGALVREKITWKHATEVIVAVDETKLSDTITVTVPIAVVPFGVSTTISRVSQLSGVEGTEIYYRGGLPFRTDDNLMIVHLTVENGSNLEGLNLQLHQTTGIVETGIFCQKDYPKMRVICGTQDGIIEF